MKGLMVVHALGKKGIQAEEIITVKNGTENKGIHVISSKKVSPIVYYEECESTETIVKRVLQATDQKISSTVYKNLTDKTYIRNHIRIRVEKRSCNINSYMELSRDLLDLRMYLRIDLKLNDDQYGSARVTDQLLCVAELSEQEAWDVALRNQKEQLHIYSIADMLSSLLPISIREEMPLFVITTENGDEGASVLALPEVFREWCLFNGEDYCLILPSSTEEVLFIPGSANYIHNPDVLADMVEEINTTEVDPIQQLEPTVYRYDLETNRIRIVASKR